MLANICFLLALVPTVGGLWYHSIRWTIELIGHRRDPARREPMAFIDESQILRLFGVTVLTLGGTRAIVELNGSRAASLTVGIEFSLLVAAGLWALGTRLGWRTGGVVAAAGLGGVLLGLGATAW